MVTGLLMFMVMQQPSSETKKGAWACNCSCSCMTLSRRVPSSLVLRWVLLCEIKLLLTCRLPAAVVGIHFNTGLLVRSAHGTGHGTGDSRHGTCHMAIELADHLLSLRRKILVALALSSASQHLYIQYSRNPSPERSYSGTRRWYSTVACYSCSLYLLQL